MANKSEILLELQQIAPTLASINNKDVYKVLPSYFESLSESILLKIKSTNTDKLSEEAATDTTLLNSIDKQNIYNVPKRYFENLSTSILERIKSEQNELSEIAPILNSIPKQKNTYSVPENYFESFKVNIAEEQTQAKIISLRRTNNLLKYAVAAAIIGVVFLGGLLYQNFSNRSTSRTDFAKEINKVSDNELNNYADAHSIQMSDEGLSTLIDDDSDEQLNIADELKSVSDEELELYASNESNESVKEDNETN